MQTFAGADANVCRGGCKRLRERLQCFASEMGKTGTEIASPILDKRVLATVLARTCDLPCTYLREKFCWRGICELDFCGPSIIASHSTNLLGGHQLSV